MGMKGLTSTMVSASDIGAARKEVVGGLKEGAREFWVEVDACAVAAALAMLAARRSK